MRLCVIVLLYWSLATVAFGQNTASDSLTAATGASNQLPVVDQKVDSIQAGFYQRSDSLTKVYKSKFTKMDSAQNALRVKLDRLRSLQITSPKMPSGNGIDSLQSGLKNKVDSLTSLQRAAASKITHGLDSINNLREETLTELNSKFQSLKDKSIGKLNDLTLPGQLSEKVSDVTSQITDFQIPAEDLDVPSFATGQSTGMGALGNLNLQAPAGEFDLGQIGELNPVDIEPGELPDVQGSVGEYGQDVKQLTKGNFNEVKALPEAAEAKAEELSGLGEVKDQEAVLDEYKELPGKMQNPDSIKALAEQHVRRVAVNHFAGKEQQLKEAMETISKYKSKYSSINNISEISKKPPNEMKGKPLIERIIPGVGIQMQKKGEDLLVDFNPYAGYRFTGRLTAGLGWNQRIGYNTNKGKFSPDARVYGPRIYGEFKLWKGFSPRAELELMNTQIPPLLSVTQDPSHREWVWGAFMGVKKEYRLIRSVKGTALVMVRLFNPERKSPYADVLNVRFGFEIPIKKRSPKN